MHKHSYLILESTPGCCGIENICPTVEDYSDETEEVLEPDGQPETGHDYVCDDYIGYDYIANGGKGDALYDPWYIII